MKTVLQGRCYTPSPLLSTDEISDLAVNSAGKLLVSSAPTWSYVSSGQTPVGTAGVVVKASAGRLRLLNISNTSATAFWVMWFNRSSAPSAAQVPVDRCYIPGTSTVGIDFGSDALSLSTGIAIGCSTLASPDSLTLLAGNTVHYFAEYE